MTGDYPLAELSSTGGRVGYLAAMLAATLCAGWLYRRSGPSELSSEQRVGIAIGGVIGATLAAKLPFIFGAGSLAAFWMGDGKTILWGLVGGYLGVELAKWSLMIRQKTGDRFVVPVAVAIGIGRFGCLANGCCAGMPTDVTWGIAAGEGMVLRHPAPLYESAFHLTFALLATWGIRNGRCKDAWMLIYLVAYCVFRFASEFWRVEPKLAFGWTFYQYSAIVFSLPFSILLVKRLDRSCSA